MVKKMLAAMTIATALATPALAQSYRPEVGSGNLVGPPGRPYSGPPLYSRHFGGAYAYVPPARRHSHHSRRGERHDW